MCGRSYWELGLPTRLATEQDYQMITHSFHVSEVWKDKTKEEAAKSWKRVAELFLKQLNLTPPEIERIIANSIPEKFIELGSIANSTEELFRLIFNADLPTDLKGS